jgi:hypothetical protein
VLTNHLVDVSLAQSAFDARPLLIARMDHVARNEELLRQLGESEWDLVIVDEAHRMGAHYFETKLEKTKRYELGELLGERTRHLLLMTATPHSGKDEEFQLFLSLLDRDRFAGKFRKGISPWPMSALLRTPPKASTSARRVARPPVEPATTAWRDAECARWTPAGGAGPPPPTAQHAPDCVGSGVSAACSTGSATPMRRGTPSTPGSR